MRLHRPLLPLAAVLLTLPAVALAASQPPRPLGGSWKVTPSAFDLTKGGSFKVNRSSRSVSALKITPGSGANSACGTTAVRVKGRLAISKASRGGSSVWIVGRNTPKTSDGISPIKVSAVANGETVSGKLKIAFRGRRGGSGELELPGCQLFFDAKRPR
jgi:hypothetical protein